MAKTPIVLTEQDKIKTLKQLSRQSVGQARAGKKIIPARGGAYKRRGRYGKQVDW